MPSRILSLPKTPTLSVVTLVLGLAVAGAAMTPRVAMAQEDEARSAAQEGLPASMTGPSSAAVPSGDAIVARMEHARVRIDAGIDDGSLDREQAHRVLEQLANIKTQAGELSTRDGGLTDTDRQFINDRLNTLSHQIRWEKESADENW